jgi:hypothetical protein
LPPLETWTSNQFLVTVVLGSVGAGGVFVLFWLFVCRTRAATKIHADKYRQSRDKRKEKIQEEERNEEEDANKEASDMAQGKDPGQVGRFTRVVNPAEITPDAAINKSVKIKKGFEKNATQSSGNTSDNDSDGDGGSGPNNKNRRSNNRSDSTAPTQEDLKMTDVDDEDRDFEYYDD